MHVKELLILQIKIFKKTKYKVVAMNDIVDTVSLKKLYSKGEIITFRKWKMYC